MLNLFVSQSYQSCLHCLVSKSLLLSTVCLHLKFFTYWLFQIKYVPLQKASELSVPLACLFLWVRYLHTSLELGWKQCFKSLKMTFLLYKQSSVQESHLWPLCPMHYSLGPPISEQTQARVIGAQCPSPTMLGIKFSCYEWRGWIKEGGLCSLGHSCLKLSLCRWEHVLIWESEKCYLIKLLSLS